MITAAGELLERARTASEEQHTTTWRGLMLVLLSELTGLEERLPDAGRSALDVAQRYWAREGSDPDILWRAKEDLWAYLDASGDTDTRATRSVLRMLEPTGDEDDASDLAQWFVSLTGQS